MLGLEVCCSDIKHVMNTKKVKLGEFNALQQNFKSLNKYEKPNNKQMQDTESRKDAIKHDMRILNRWVADQYAKLLSYKVESMDIPTRDFTGMFDLAAQKSSPKPSPNSGL